MATYNGHRSWNSWNVALWIGNDETLYRHAMSALTDRVRQHDGVSFRAPTLRDATRRFMLLFGGDKTPDGAKYNSTCVREALAGLKS